MQRVPIGWISRNLLLPLVLGAMRSRVTDLGSTRWLIPKRRQSGFEIVAPCAQPGGKHDGVACGPNS